jgi:hypothetical protein
MWGVPKDKTPLTDEIPRHKKSSNKKAPKKADHKHDYVHCIGKYIRNTYDYQTGHPKQVVMFSHITRCTICGKIGSLDYATRRKLGLDPWFDFNCEQTLPEKYPHLEVVNIPAPW